MTKEELDMLRNLCIFMINWAEREPDSILPDPLNDAEKKEILDTGDVND